MLEHMQTVVQRSNAYALLSLRHFAHSMQPLNPPAQAQPLGAPGDAVAGADEDDGLVV